MDRARLQELFDELRGEHERILGLVQDRDARAAELCEEEARWRWANERPRLLSSIGIRDDLVMQYRRFPNDLLEEQYPRLSVPPLPQPSDAAGDLAACADDLREARAQLREVEALVHRDEAALRAQAQRIRVLLRQPDLQRRMKLDRSAERGQSRMTHALEHTNRLQEEAEVKRRDGVSPFGLVAAAWIIVILAWLAASGWGGCWG